MSTTGTEGANAVDRALIQTRTIRVLMVSVIPAGMATAGIFPTTSLLAKELTGSDTLSGFASAFLAVGGAIAAVPLARVMASRGRRVGLRIGWTIAAVGAALSFLAATLEFFPLLILGSIGIGSGNAANLSTRYAAADLADDSNRGRSISFVVWATTVGSVMGPTIASGPSTWLAESFGLPRLAGPYALAVVAFSTAAFFSNRFLRPDPLVVSGGVASSRKANRVSVAESFRKLWSVPLARLAVLAMAVGHAVMVGVMTMTPLHMKDGNHELKIIGFVISLHIVGMYAFSPLVGMFVDRFGPRPIIAAAGVVLFAGAELASHTDPQDSLGVFTGLFLIGLGWSFNLIAGSSILTATFTPEERATTQGASDLIMVGSGASAGLAAGAVVEWSGFHSLAHWAGVGALSLPLIAGLAIIGQRRSNPAPA